MEGGLGSPCTDKVTTCLTNTEAEVEEKEALADTSLTKGETRPAGADMYTEEAIATELGRGGERARESWVGTGEVDSCCVPDAGEEARESHKMHSDRG